MEHYQEPMSSNQLRDSDRPPPLVSTSEGNNSSDSKPSAESSTDTSKPSAESATDSNSSGNEEPKQTKRFSRNESTYSNSSGNKEPSENKRLSRNDSTDSNSSGNEEPIKENKRDAFPVTLSKTSLAKKEQEDSDSSPPSDDSPYSGNPDSEDKQSTESGTGSDSGSNNNAKRIPISRTENGGSPTFPVKLHLILSTKEFAKIVAWLPHGRAWRILDHKALEEKVIPLYFRHGRYSSFARQINGWGFKRIVHGADYNAYYHETFLRGLPHLCAKMKRPTTKNSANKGQVDSSDISPDFYAMSRLQPLPEHGSGNPSPLAITEVEVSSKADATVGKLPPSLEAAPPANTTREQRKAEALKQIARLLDQNPQNPPVGNSGPLNSQQLSTILSVLNGALGGGTRAEPVPPPAPAASVANPLLQLLAGLNGRQASMANSTNHFNQPQANPQAQLAALTANALLQYQQTLAASGSSSINQAAILDYLVNKGNSQNQQPQSSILQALLNSGAQNSNNSSHLQKAFWAQQSTEREHAGQVQQDQASTTATRARDTADAKPAATQGPAKRQRQTQQQDSSSTSQSPSVSSISALPQPPASSSQPSSSNASLAALLNQLSGGGGPVTNPTSNAISQLASSMLQNQQPPNKNLADLLASLQQPGQGPVPPQQQQPGNNSALADMLAALQQRGSQVGNNPSQSPTDALMAVLQQQGLGGANARSEVRRPSMTGQLGQQDQVSGLLQQMLTGARAGQQTATVPDSSLQNRGTGNTVMDALQFMVQPQAASVTPPANATLAQLQQLLMAQNQGLGGNNQGAAMSQQHLNQSQNGQMQASAARNSSNDNESAAGSFSALLSAFNKRKEN